MILKQVPGFAEPLILGFLAVGIKRNGLQARDFRFGDDVPRVLEHDVCGEEIEGARGIASVASANGAAVSSVLFEDGRLDLNVRRRTRDVRGQSRSCASLPKAC